MDKRTKKIVQLANKLTDLYLANREHEDRHWFVKCITPHAHGRKEMLASKNVAALWVQLHDLLVESK